MQERNLYILLTCQLIGACGSIVFVIIGGIVGSQLAANPALATLPVSLMVVGTACTTIPASVLMRRVGRRTGMSASALLACLAVLGSALALQNSSFVMFCATTFVYGCTLAFVQQYRFAAAESVGPAMVSRAISLVLLGSIGGAIVGPELTTRGRNLLGGGEYVGTMLGLAGLLLIAAGLLLALRNPPPAPAHEARHAARPLRVVVRQPAYMLAVLGGVVGYGVMSFIMTATPLSMHVLDGHSLEATSGVVRSHVLAMYAPSLVSGYLIDRLGVGRMMTAGAILMVGTVLFGLAGQQIMHYWLALVSLGVGWNFLYVGGTTLLTRSYRSAERFKSQAINDFSIFSVAALASLLSGTILQAFGWNTVVVVAIPPLVLMLVALYFVRLRPAAARGSA